MLNRSQDQQRLEHLLTLGPRLTGCKQHFTQVCSFNQQKDIKRLNNYSFKYHVPQPTIFLGFSNIKNFNLQRLKSALELVDHLPFIIFFNCFYFHTKIASIQYLNIWIIFMSTRVDYFFTFFNVLCTVLIMPNPGPVVKVWTVVSLV